MKIDANLPPVLENDTLRQIESVPVPKAKVANDPAEPAVPERDLEQTVKTANEMLKMVDARCEFEIDKDTNLEIIKVVDNETGEVIKQYPSEQIVDLVNRIYDMLGFFVDKKF